MFDFFPININKNVILDYKALKFKIRFLYNIMLYLNKLKRFENSKKNCMSF